MPDPVKTPTLVHVRGDHLLCEWMAILAAVAVLACCVAEFAGWF